MSGDQLNLDTSHAHALLLARARDAVTAIDKGDVEMIRRGAARQLASEDVPALVAEVRHLREEVRDLNLQLAEDDDDDEPFPDRWHGLTLTPWQPIEPTE